MPMPRIPFEYTVDFDQFQDLTQVAAAIWSWHYENTPADMDENDAMAEADDAAAQAGDEFSDVYPDRCPQLESEHAARVAAGVAQARAETQARAERFANYQPAPWIVEAMSEADRVMDPSAAAAPSP